MASDEVISWLVGVTVVSWDPIMLSTGRAEAETRGSPERGASVLELLRRVVRTAWQCGTMELGHRSTSVQLFRDLEP